jgi:hypothetical protein
MCWLRRGVRAGCCPRGAAAPLGAVHVHRGARAVGLSQARFWMCQVLCASTYAPFAGWGPLVVPRLGALVVPRQLLAHLYVSTPRVLTCYALLSMRSSWVGRRGRYHTRVVLFDRRARLMRISLEGQRSRYHTCVALACLNTAGSHFQRSRYHTCRVALACLNTAGSHFHDREADITRVLLSYV